MIVRGQRPQGNFYILDKRISEDRRLSWAARGLLVFLLGKPDHWRFSLSELARETQGTSHQTGIDGLRTLMRELKDTGHYIPVKRCPPASKSARMPQHLWGLVRASVFERDDFTCQYCGERGGRLECDHVLPVARGGGNEPENLKTACYACNRSKRDHLLADWMKARSM